MADETKGYVVTLDLNDDALVARLKAKVEEYKDRLEHQSPYKAPEQYTGTRYKLRILEGLLQNGMLDTWELSRQIAAEGPIYGRKFNNACAVVEDYILHAGANNTGGKLPVVQ